MNPEIRFPLDEVKEVIHKWLYLEDDRIVDVMIATHVANQLAGDPTWTLIIGPPSSSKTELLRSFDGHRKAYFLSNLTPSTLVSGKPGKAKRGAKGSTCSLLPKLSGKTLVLKDFTTILSMRSENQQEILSQLREIYDGSYSKGFGNEAGTVSWEGHIGLLGACTPVYDRHHSVVGALGERFLLYRTSVENGEEMGLRAQEVAGKERQMRNAIKKAVHRFIDQFRSPHSFKLREDPTTNHMIVTLANFCAHARCSVDRDRYHGTLDYVPEPEGPARLVKQFTQLGRALALIHSKDRIDGDVYEIIKKVGCDLMPRQRLKVLSHVWRRKAYEHLEHWERTTEISEGLRLPPKTVLRVCEDLMVARLLNKELSGESENAGYKWQVDQKAYDMVKAAEIFGVTTNETF
jgi:hypothetical protein